MHTSLTLNPGLALNPNTLTGEGLERVATRDGFGKGLLEAGKRNANVVALTADLGESCRAHWFAEKYPDRFIQVGVAEQNLVTVSSGLAAAGKIPFCTSFGAFNPGRNWEQIRTTICYNDQNVKVIASHTGLSVGEDGATHQILEDIALMRVLPNMVVIVPVDATQAHRATVAMSAMRHPMYMRVAREKSQVFTTPDTPFEIGTAQVFIEGSDVTLIGAGSVLYEGIKAASMLAGRVSVEVINLHTIKPIDVETIVASVRKTGCVVSLEEHQVNGGVGSAVAEVLAQYAPAPMEYVGVQDRFGESGKATELWKHYGLTAEHIIERINAVVARRG